MVAGRSAREDQRPPSKLNLANRRSSRERADLQSQLAAVRAELEVERAKSAQLAVGVCKVEKGAGANVIRGLQKQLAVSEEKLRGLEGDLHAVTAERDELRDRLRGAVTSSPTTKEQQLSDDPLHKEKNALRDQICTYLRTETDLAEQCVKNLEDELTDLAKTADEARRAAKELSDRAARAEQNAEEASKKYDAAVAQLKKTHQAALAEQVRVGGEKLKREQAASEKAIKRLDQVARGALDAKEVAIRRVRVFQFQLEQAKLKARTPLATKSNNTVARKPALPPQKLGELDLFVEAKAAYFPRAIEQLKQAELELKGWKPVATIQELTAAAIVLDRYFELLHILNLSETDVYNLLLGADDFAAEVAVAGFPSLAELLQGLRRSSASRLKGPDVDLKAQAFDFRRRWKKALRDLSWEVKLHKADVKKLELCEATIEAMAQEKGDLWAKYLRAESEPARLETVIGGLEAAVEAASASKTIAAAVTSLERAVISMNRWMDAQREVRTEYSVLREESAFEGLRALFGEEDSQSSC